MEGDFTFHLTASGAVALGHFDSACVDGLSTMLGRLQDLSMGYFDQAPVQMHLVGGFSDSRGYSEDLIYSLLRKSEWNVMDEWKDEIWLPVPEYINKERFEIEIVSACKFAIVWRWWGVVMNMENWNFVGIGQYNTIIRGDIPWPILYGVGEFEWKKRDGESGKWKLHSFLGVNVRTGEIVPATFPDKGPDLPLRGTRIFCGSPSVIF